MNIAISFDSEGQRLERLRQFCGKNEIIFSTIIKLRNLEDFEIVCICDDSGSMRTEIEGKGITRWDQLRRTVNIVLELATTLDKDGVDIFFLNRPPILCIKSQNEVLSAFNLWPPEGYTPIVDTLNSVLTAKAKELKERKVLVVIVTDGQPTTTAGNINTDEFMNVVCQKPPNLYVSIVACTDEKDVVQFLESLVQRKIPNVDVSEDYEEEKKKFLKIAGKILTFGDYVCKILLGPIDANFVENTLLNPPNNMNTIDEHHVEVSNNHKISSNRCCSIT